MKMDSSDLKIVQYAEARARELIGMATLANKVTGNKLVKQRIPRHMRRRAASHNIKRLPRRLREAVKREMLQNPPSKSKRPSRKHRRRSKNFLEQNRKRHDGKRWLESHIWHAKRFHMSAKWGYMLASHPNDKGSRSAYRALNNKCIIQDQSFQCCFEICGPRDKIISSMTRLTSNEIGLSFGAQLYTSGKYEGKTVLYMADKYPHCAIGPVSFHWKPELQKTENESSLWIWCHPASYFLTLIQCMCVLEMRHLCNISSDNLLLPESETEIGKELARLEALESLKHGCYTINLLRNELCRIRLMGPSSHSIITNVLEPAVLTADSKDDNTHLLTSYSDINEMVKDSEEQDNLWKALREVRLAGELPAKLIMSFCVKEPIFNPTSKGMPIITERIGTSRTMHELDLPTCASPLWNKSVRHACKIKKSFSDMYQAKTLLPGPRGMESSRVNVPVMLIQNHDSVSTSNSNIADGWDLILPAGWTMAFWLPFIYSGCQACGLEDLQEMYLSQNILPFPSHYPDTRAGVEEQKSILSRSLSCKTCSSTLLLNPMWRQLFSKTSKDSEPMSQVNNVFVERSKQKLRKISKLCSNITSHKELGNYLNANNLCVFIPVEIEMVTKGNPKNMSVICVPQIDDIISTDSCSDIKPEAKPNQGCHRDIAGIVFSGGFSFSAGKGNALGFVTLEALLKCVEVNLKRNQDGKQIKLLAIMHTTCSSHLRLAHLRVNVI